MIDTDSMRASAKILQQDNAYLFVADELLEACYEIDSLRTQLATAQSEINRLIQLQDYICDSDDDAARLRQLTAQLAQPEEITYQHGEWFKAKTVEEMQRFYLSRLPAIREAARACGYAIGLHGSARRDFDLIAMQWRDGADDINTLAKAIKFAACGISCETVTWELKPEGRMATSLPICWTAWHDMVGAGHIDLSVIAQPQEPIAWESTSIAFTRYITDSRYKNFTPTSQSYYKPYKCASCMEQEPAAQDETGWLIEEFDHSLAHRWLRLIEDQYSTGSKIRIVWAFDSSVALRFSREEDARLFASLHLDFCGICKITNHSWLSTAQQPSGVNPC